ncbi:uncharacterized protein LOC100899369 [Galendromus occidentalis]|uniref:Uncharacterized protein LOC100899369 n=1 Tax=Galendromus occidentalis TaxID=34638 RepID=A0AAJ6QVP8_9ACAR|nr:uncharacterized protein LOC100899369 [Galendromus occidentalis]
MTRPLCIAPLLLLLVMSLAPSDASDHDAEETVEHEDRPELQQCRDSNKGKWCTCRKLLKFVEKRIGQVLGLYIPQCGRFKPKLFQPKQCSGAKCWCVNHKSGRIIRGSLREDHEMRTIVCNPLLDQK